MTLPSARVPVAYIPHGGGPWPFADLGMPPEQSLALSEYLKALAALPPSPPRAILCVSAHWEQPVPTVMTHPAPPMLYDYSGFPPETYKLQWSAPGSAELAARVRELLTSAGFESAQDNSRGFDHGTFIPLMLTYPNAEIPTIQLSLIHGLEPDAHIRMGQALAALRNEGVFIIGSGMSYHNMRGFFRPDAADASEAFDTWLTETVTAAPAVRDDGLRGWERAPMARQVHPREEHLLPLMVVAGAAGDDVGRLAFQGRYMAPRISAYHFG